MRPLIPLGPLFSCCALPVALALAVTAATAQPISFDPEDPAPKLIPFRAEPKLGHVGRAEGVVDGAGKRFYVDELDVMSPLLIRVFAKDESKPIEVSLHRFFWREANLEGRTNETGDWGWAGRVHDEVGIELRAEQPSEFYVLAWHGPAFEPAYGAAVFTAPEGSGPAATAASTIPWLPLLAVLLAITVAILWLRLRRVRTVAAVVPVVLLLASPPGLQAQDFEGRLGTAEGSLAELWDFAIRLATAHNDVRDGAVGEIGELRGQISELRDYTYRLAEMHNDVRDGAVREIGELREAFAALGEYIQEAQLTTAYDIASLEARVTALELLDEDDERAEPDPTHGGVAPMPTLCYNQPGCSACFEATHAKVRDQMRSYAKLRAIYSSGDGYLTRMTNLGDAHSGWHQLEQAQWYTEKQKIGASHEKLRSAYRARLQHFNERLKNTLKEYDECEARFGLEDWYRRYGEPFYLSLTAGYQIP